VKITSPRSRRGILALTLVVAGTGLAAFLFAGPRTKEVAVYTAAVGPAERVLAVNGRIRPRLQVDIRPALGGTLVALPFDVGDKVKQGDTIAKIDDGPEAAAITAAEAAVQSQQVILAQARRDLARYEALGEFASGRDVEQKRLAVEEGGRELNRRRAAVVQASELQGRRVLRAPFGGVILERPADPGQTVSPESVIYRLADLSNPEITAEVDELYAAEIRPEMEALVRLAGRPETLRAKVLYVEPRVDPASGARNVRVTLEDGLRDPPAGLTVTINFMIERRAMAISNPRSALIEAGGKVSALIADPDGIVRERALTFIEWPAAQVIVTSGVEAGERILTDPASAKPGDKVRIAN
jgi:RND family efflux transporter MFP subunit